MTKTQTPRHLSHLAHLSGNDALVLRDSVRRAQTQLAERIETDLIAQGINPDTYTGTDHPGNEEYLELADLEADLNELLADRY